MKKMFFCVVLLSLVVTPLFAQDNQGQAATPATAPATPAAPADQKISQAWTKMLEKFDTNKDSLVSKEEFTSSDPGFVKLDVNKDGVISDADVPPQAQQAQGPKANKAKMVLQRQIKMSDTDGNGQVSKEEWMARKVKLFERLDKNKDGSISKEEFESAGKMAQQFMKMAMEKGAAAK
jgi:Ca2+-binding EF-hand superfamily protein